MQLKCEDIEKSDSISSNTTFAGKSLQEIVMQNAGAASVATSSNSYRSQCLLLSTLCVICGHFVVKYCRRLNFDFRQSIFLCQYTLIVNGFWSFVNYKRTDFDLKPKKMFFSIYLVYFFYNEIVERTFRSKMFFRF